MTSAAPPDAPRRRPILVPVLAVLAAAAIGVSAAFGGLEDAPEPKAEQLGKGATFDQGKMKTVFEDAVVRPGRIGLGVPDKRYLQLILKVTNQSKSTIQAEGMTTALIVVRADGKTIMPASDPGDRGPRVVVIAGDKAYYQLHPDVPETVVMSFELPDAAPTPKTVQIDAGTYEWYESFFSKTHEWMPVIELGPPTAEDRKRGRRESSLPVVGAKITMPVRVEAA
ncbi:hypothetical protein AB0M95_14735 [Sphaerisporangium sp. NPDC051017]|uniref:hypothetical protein n=1 Tax=Sphaerisporangium sp. NPDC051017 TaxID=3154636 RepID=UPI003440CDA4